MTARRWTGGGMPIPSGAPAAIGGDDRRNLHIAFENLSASAAPAVPRLEPGRATFKFGNLLQAMRDVFALIFIALFLTVTAAAIPVAIFILLFVGVR